MMKNRKGRKCAALLFAVLFGVTAVSGCMGKSQQKAFDEFIQQEFADTMEQNWLNTHIFMEHPENYGVNMENVPVELSPPVNDAYFEKIQTMNAACEEAFAKFDREKLTKAQQNTYDIYQYMLKNAVDASSDEMKYFNYDFGTLTGSYTQIPTLLADLQLRGEEDVKALVTLVKSVKDYLDSSAAFLKEQEAHGTLMIDTDEVRTYCEGVVETGMNSSTLVSMKENIDGVAISDNLKETYKKQIEEAFETSYIPAYENVIAVLDSLDESKNNKGGLATISGGKEAYEVMFRDATGTSKSIGEVQEMLSGMLKASIEELQKAAFSDVDVYIDWMNGEVTSGYSDFESMLEALGKAMKADFPEIADVSYDIRPLPADLENSGVQAYYNIPALDHSGNQMIRVNTGDDTMDVESLNTFATVAHEGFPGHMYQYNYCYSLDLPVWQKTVAASGGFVEGYATYVQLYALKYLDVPETAVTIEQLNNIVSFMAVALSDIGIHYEGWDVEALASYLSSMGLNGAVAEELYDQLRVNPTAFLSYYVGYAEIIQLREKAETALGEQFDDKAFHAALLANSGANFAVVERSIDAYIADAQKK